MTADPSPLADALDGAEVVICCGSGGVGKTTTAAALGLGAARRGERVLVLTIDPAKRLADALGLKEVGNIETRVALARTKGELSVAMLDTSASWDALVRRHAPDPSTRDKILANPLYRNITQRFVQSHDYIAMERLYELQASGHWDRIVIDTPPSRHALDFIDAPERMAGFFSSSLLKWITLPYRVGGARAGRLGYLAAKPFYQLADRILGSQFLESIAEFFLLFQTMHAGFVQRARSVTALLREPTTRFVVVSTIRPAPLREAEFFLAELGRRQLTLGAMVLNRVSPLEFCDPEAKTAATALAARPEPDLREAGATFLIHNAIAEQEKAQLDRLAFAPETVVRVPDFDADIASIAGLTVAAKHLWGG